MDPRDTSIPQWPVSYQIEPHRFFFDPLSTWFGGARYVGHKFIRDKADILEEADGDSGWNRDAVEAIAAGAGLDEFPERKDNDRASGVDRGELVLYEIWVPEKHIREPKDGFHGALYTLAVAQGQDGSDDKAEFIREPRAYFGPRWGPYTLYGTYPVPGDPFPLSPFAAVYRQVKELNEITKASNESIRKYKKLVLVSQDNPDLARKIKDGVDLMVLPVKGLDKKQVVEIELGGITSQHKDQIRDALERVDRNTGIDQTQRGNLEKGLTATAVAVAESSASAALAFVKQEFTDATVQVLNSAAWFMYNEDRVEFPLGEEAADELGMGEPWFKGGMGGEASYDDLELEIEPMSMERMNESLMRSNYVEQMKMLLEAAAVIPSAPFYDWNTIFDRGGDALNDPMLSEIFNPDLAAMVTGMQMSQGLAPPVPAGGAGGSAAPSGPPTRQLAGRVSGGKLGAAQRSK
jgi:hypothetical protein